MATETPMELAIEASSNKRRTQPNKKHFIMYVISLVNREKTD